MTSPIDAKRLEEPTKLMLEGFGQTEFREGSRADYVTASEWEDYLEVPLPILGKIATALASLKAENERLLDRVTLLEQVLRWCRPRLSKDAYRDRFDQMVSLPPPPPSGEPKLVQSARAVLTDTAREESKP